jgi:hypothetical protein
MLWAIDQQAHYVGQVGIAVVVENPRIGGSRLSGAGCPHPSSGCALCWSCR